MSMPQPNISIKQSGANSDEYDVELERAVVYPPSTLNLSAPAGNMVFTLDGIDDDDAAKAKEERRASSMPKIKKALVGCTVLGVVGTIAGVAIGGAAEYKQQQNAMAAIKGGVGSSKSGKSGSFCEPEPVIECGQTFTDEKLRTLNAAIKVEGADAVIDCKGHAVRQLTSKYAASCEVSPSSSDDERSLERKTMKETCDLFYQVGIWLIDGASAINCNVEHFYDGFFVENSGEVKKSEASGNRRGVVWLSGSTTKISDVYAHGNHIGIDGDLSKDPRSDEVTIEKVTSKYNFGDGMSLRGPEINVKDSTANHNGDDGIRVIAETDSSATNVIFEGVVSSYHNEKHGIAVENSFDSNAPYEAEVTVKGMLNTYLNGRDGLFIRKDTIVNDFTVEDEGSFSSCNNSQGPQKDFDIGVKGNANFVDEGTDGYTCDTTGRSNQVTFPTCMDCPACV
eukprot:scaffold10518_cov78-Skeletonema_dohrnii-CCMP3373.AAC.2